MDVWQTGSTRMLEVDTKLPHVATNYEPRYVAIIIMEELLHTLINNEKAIPHRLMPIAARWARHTRHNDADDEVLSWVTIDPEDGHAIGWLAYGVD